MTDDELDAVFDSFPEAKRPEACKGNSGRERDAPPPVSGPEDFGLPSADTREDIPGDKPLPFIDISNWDNEPAPKREWAVQDRMPLRQVSLFSGEGSIGKTVALLQLSGATVLAKDWLGTMPEPGPALYLGAEDAADEVHRRVVDIAAHYGARISELIGHLHLLDFAGQDAILGRANRNGLVHPTKLFAQVKEAACDIRPKIISLDTAADIFAGNENDRAQVRQFIGQLRGMAIAANSAIIVAGHPSLTGISTGTGLSGSTAWHNSVRSRMYFKPATTDAGEQPDPELRELQFLKNNYGPKAEKILLRWKNGVFVSANVMGSLDKMAADQNAERVFLSLLGKFNHQRRDISPKPSKIYAPTLFASDPEAGGIKAKAFEQAMSRLLDTNKIHIVPEGPPSRSRRRLVVGAPNDGF